MDFSTTIVEAGATLRDPHFAFGFFVTAVLLGAASFSAVILWRHENPKLRTLSGAAALISIPVAVGARTLISLLANVAVRASGGTDVVVHYWYTSPYVWSVWGFAGSALLAAVVARTRERESGTK